MSQNLPIKWRDHAIKQAALRNIEMAAVDCVILNANTIVPGNKNHRELFIGIIGNNGSPVVAVCSAATNGKEFWNGVITVYKDRKYKLI
jgi:hypothetical protein